MSLAELRLEVRHDPVFREPTAGKNFLPSSDQSWMVVPPGAPPQEAVFYKRGWVRGIRIKIVGGRRRCESAGDIGRNEPIRYPLLKFLKIYHGHVLIQLPQD